MEAELMSGCEELEVRRLVGRAVRQARLSLGWSLEALATRVGCRKGYLSAIERGLRPPPRAGLASRIEAELGLPRGSVERAGMWCRADAEVRASGATLGLESELGGARDEAKAKGLIPLDGRLVGREGGPWFAVPGSGGGAWVVGVPREGPVRDMGPVVVWSMSDGVPRRWAAGVGGDVERGVWKWAPIVGRLELVGNLAES